MNMNIIPILALTWKEGYALWEKAHAKAEMYDTIFYVVAVYIFTYVIFFCATGMAGWYKDIPSAPLIILAGVAVMFAIMIFAANRSLYWMSWTPNFLASS